MFLAHMHKSQIHPLCRQLLIYRGAFFQVTVNNTSSAPQGLKRLWLKSLIFIIRCTCKHTELGRTKISIATFVQLKSFKVHSATQAHSILSPTVNYTLLNSTTVYCNALMFTEMCTCTQVFCNNKVKIKKKTK